MARPEGFTHQVAVPRLHPNGFVQFDLGPNQRLNIWDESLPPAQTINTPIHDHTFDFSSRVVAGKLFHIVYDFAKNPHGQDCLWGVVPWRTGDETVLEPLAGMVGDAVLFETNELPAGSGYTFGAGLFHETKHEGFTATVMTKTRKNVTEGARVVVPVGGSVDNDFRRDQYPLEKLSAFVLRAIDALDEETRDKALLVLRG